MTFHDPNMLNPFVLFGSHHSAIVCLLTSAISASLAFTVSWSFYRSYRFSGLSYLIAIPIGFAFLGVSFIFEYFSLIYRFKVSNYNDADISISEEEQYLDPKITNGTYNHLHTRLGNRVRKAVTGSLFVGLILMSFLVPISDLTFSPYFDYAKLSDLAVYMNIFNMIILGYILRNVVLSLVEKFDTKSACTLASFALLWISQFFMLLTYYTYSPNSLIISAATRLAGLFIFIYLIYYARFYALKRILKIETR